MPNDGVGTVRPAEEKVADWQPLLARAVAGVGVCAAYQPIVDLARGSVVGFEALARFTGGAACPERWFEAARDLGLAAQLEVATLTVAFAGRPSLPHNCFLAVNITPDALAQPAVRQVLDRQGDLSGVVIELTEQTRIDSYVALEPHLDRYRAAGALIAVDDAGSGYAGLQHLIGLHPSIIKLDRQFIDGIDRDEAKRALVDMVGTFADRTDCWLLAEGVERPEELAVLVDLGVPLAQGFLLGRPAPPWAGIEPRALMQLRSRGANPSATLLRDLIEPGLSVADLRAAAGALAAHPERSTVVVVDQWHRPTGAVDREALAGGMDPDIMRFNVDTPIAEAARRCITRRLDARFQPLICTDNAGRYVGIVPLERLIDKLASQAPGPPPTEAARPRWAECLPAARPGGRRDATPLG